MTDHLWLLWYYLKHPREFLCDRGLWECKNHKAAGFYEYLQSTVTPEDDDADIPPWQLR